MEKKVLNIFEQIKKPTLLFGFEVKRDVSPNLSSYLGGKPYMIKNEKYPECSECKQKMNFIFQLNIPDKQGDDRSLYTFYYCFHCQIDTGEKGFVVRTFKNPTIKEMKVSQTPEYIPYAELLFEPFWSLPDWDEACQLVPDLAYRTDERQYEELKVDMLGYSGYEVLTFFGGYPQFIREVDTPVCSCCQKPMTFWIQVDTLEELDLIWGNIGCLYVFRCPEGRDRFSIRVQS